MSSIISFEKVKATKSVQLVLKVLEGTSLFLVALTGAFVISGCSKSAQPAYTPISAKEVAAPDSTTGEKKKQQIINYVSPGYEITLTSIEDKNLNGKYRVDFENQLKLPYDITIDCTKLTQSSLKQKITESYKPYFKSEPKLQVALSERKYYVDVQGLVKSPGQFLVKSGATLDDVIALAEGLKESESEDQAKYAKITQGKGEEQKVRFIRMSDYYSGGEVSPVQWQGGDRIFFQSEPGPLQSGDDTGQKYIQLVGQVVTPGEYLYSEESDFLDYLTKAGGPTSQADLQQIEIIREEQGKKQSIPFKMSEVAELPKIEGGDLVLVHSQDPNTVIPNTTGIIGSITSILFVIFGI